MHTFASKRSRRRKHRLFWRSHMLYPLFYVTLLLHGIEGLLQEPRFHYYLIIPGTIFIIDRMITLRRAKNEVPVLDFRLLQSGVLALEMYRPKSFVYKSGQYFKIACTALSRDEFHPFTITSSPNDDYLSCHILAVGPWTKNLRKTFADVESEMTPKPKMLVDGPFGEGHQNWTNFEVSVLVGAGIGVTPFASIIKDLAQVRV